MPTDVARYEKLRCALLVVCGSVAAAVGLLVFVGWAGDVSAFKSVLPGLATMKANSALAFVFAGISLLTLGVQKPNTRQQRVLGLFGACGVTTVAVLTLLQYATAVDFGIDQLLFIDSPANTTTRYPGRMAQITGILFLLVGLTLLLAHVGHAPVLTQAFAAITLVVSLLCCLSYLYGANSLQSVTAFSSVALHTAVVFLIVSMGLFAASPEKGLVGLLISGGLGGVLVRRILPAAIVTPVVMGWLRLLGQQAGWYGTEFDLALYAISNVTVFTSLVIWTAVQVQHADSQRQAADMNMRESEQRFDLAVRGSNDGVWDWDILTGKNYFSERCVEMWGYEPGELPPGYESWAGRLHPEDRPRVESSVQRHLRERTPYDEEYRFQVKSGEWRWFRSRGQAVWDDASRALRMAGSITDITDRRRNEERLSRFNEELEDQVAERTRQLHAREQKFRAIFHSQFQFIGLMSPTGLVLEANRTALAAAGVPEDAVIGKPFWETAWWAHDLAQQERLREAVRRAAAGERDRFEASHPTATGSLMWVDFSLTPFRDETGEVILLIPEGRDITDRKKTEQALQMQEERFRSAFDHAPIGLALVAPDGKWLRVNASLCEMIGYTEAELLVTDFQTITHPDDLAADLAHVRDMLAGRIVTYQMEKRYFHKRGPIVHVLLAVSLVRDADGQPQYFISQLKDNTQRKLAEERVNASLREKEVLLKEIHHRVKNNLQIVSTLLDLQSDYTQDRQAQEMFLESRGRVKSMALIHERLYSSQDLSRVNFVDYVRQMAQDLYRTYKVSDHEIVLHVEVAVPPLPIDIAIPCGLLLNELLANSLKHAFPDGSGGWIRVSLRNDGANTVLSVADNGRGVPTDFDFRQTTSFGLQLVHTLTEQLRGEVVLHLEQGTEFVVTFPVPHADPVGDRP